MISRRLQMNGRSWQLATGTPHHLQAPEHKDQRQTIFSLNVKKKIYLHFRFAQKLTHNK